MRTYGVLKPISLRAVLAIPSEYAAKSTPAPYALSEGQVSSLAADATPTTLLKRVYAAGKPGPPEPPLPVSYTHLTLPTTPYV